MGRFKKLFFVVFLLLSLLQLASCSPSKPAGSKKPLVLVSIAPYRFLAEQIAGPGVEVRTIVPMNADPHSFEPTANQVAEISKGEIWFRIGEPFEGKILSILNQRNFKLTVQDLREGIALIEEGPSLTCHHCSMDHYDRHIWLSPKMAIVQAALIEKTLSEKYPEQSSLYKKNLQDLQRRLVELDAEIAALLAPVTKRVILVSHPAFGYFCKDYDFEQLSVEYEGKEPRPRHLEQIAKKAHSQSMELALALPQYNNKGAQIIAEKLHVPIRMIDPYSADYFETLRKLAHLIADPHGK